MIYIGIDPGKTGAIVAMDEKASIIYCCDTPDIAAIKNAIADICKIEPACKCALEQVHAMPGQGVTSMFSFGLIYGAAQAVLQVWGVPYLLVRPQAWSKGLISPGLDKNERKMQSLSFANLRYADSAKYLKRKKDHGRADAMHIADYARRYYSMN